MTDTDPSDSLFMFDVPIETDARLSGWFIRYEVFQDPHSPEYYTLSSRVAFRDPLTPGAPVHSEGATDSVSFTIAALEQILSQLRSVPEVPADKSRILNCPHCNGVLEIHGPHTKRATFRNG